MKFKSLYLVGCLILFLGLFWLFLPHLNHNSQSFALGGSHALHFGADQNGSIFTLNFLVYLAYGIVLVIFGLFIVSIANKYKNNNVKKEYIVFIVALLIALLFLGSVLVVKDVYNDSIQNSNLNNTSQTQNSSVIGNQYVLSEINRLIIPLEKQTIMAADFDNLKTLTEGDAIASGEVTELIVLAKHKEYAHIGHGLGFLYDYIKTGKEQLCPGHSLSHYYVFLKDGEQSLANDNLNEAKANLPLWESIEENQSQIILADQNYTLYKTAIISAIDNIDKGNSTVSEDQSIIFQMLRALYRNNKYIG